MEENEVKMEMEDIFNCEICNTYYKNKNALKDHHSYVHEILVVMCELCGMEFKNKRHLRHHEKQVHVADKVAVCKECNKEFKNEKRLWFHMGCVHAKSDDCFCHICGSQFRNDYALKKHIRKCSVKPRKSVASYIKGYQPDSEDRYCVECDKTFRTVEIYQTHHTKLHVNEQWTCTICQHSTSTASNLRLHYRRHHNFDIQQAKETVVVRKEYKSPRIDCPRCGKNYSSTSSHRSKHYNCSPPEPKVKANSLPPSSSAPSVVTNIEKKVLREEQVRIWKEMQKTQVKTEPKKTQDKIKKEEDEESDGEDCTEDGDFKQDDLDSVEKHEFKKELDDFLEAAMIEPEIKVESATKQVKEDIKDETYDDYNEVAFEDEVEDTSFKEQSESDSDNENGVSFEVDLGNNEDDDVGEKEFLGETLEAAATKDGQVWDSSINNKSTTKPPRRMRDKTEILADGESQICPQCGISVKKVQKHIRDVHEAPPKPKAPPPRSVPKEKNFICEICSSDFTTKAILKNHIKNIHETPEAKQCGECGKHFKYRSLLYNHVTTVHENKKESCMYCQKQCKNKTALRKHVKHNHSEMVKQFGHLRPTDLM